MNDWRPRRFWTASAVVKTERGHTVALDGRPIRTPFRSALDLPTREMAEAMAREWDAQEEVVDPRTMPVTRAANSAIDKVAPQRAAVADMLADYGDSDLTCYRAPEPQGLVDRQNAAWNPLLDWAAERYRARLIPVEGVIHQPQPAASVAALRRAVHDFDPFELTALHDLVTLSGSLVIGLAAAARWMPAADLWERSRIDETWQEEQWGVDQEAAEMARSKRTAFLDAFRFLELSRK